jgi:hypothetical protein
MELRMILCTSGLCALPNIAQSGGRELTSGVSNQEAIEA